MIITHLYVLAKKVLRRMPFLPQPSPFIRAWNRHQETQECASDGWVVKEDMGKIGAKETDVEDRTVWRKMIHCGYP